MSTTNKQLPTATTSTNTPLQRCHCAESLLTTDTCQAAAAPHLTSLHRSIRPPCPPATTAPMAQQPLTPFPSRPSLPPLTRTPPPPDTSHRSSAASAVRHPRLDRRLPRGRRRGAHRRRGAAAARVHHIHPVQPAQQQPAPQLQPSGQRGRASGWRRCWAGWDGGTAVTYGSGLAAATALIKAVRPRRIYSEAGYHGVKGAFRLLEGAGGGGRWHSGVHQRARAATTR